MKKRKLEPAVQTFNVLAPNGKSTVDLSQCASILNRRFYRQGINWVVAGFRVFKPGATPTPGTGVVISKLPNTWVLGNAWEKAFRHWQELNKKAVEAGESLPGRFTDFKVYADELHHANGSGANLRPISTHPVTGVDTVATAGEWEYSKMIIPDDSSPGNIRTREIICIGPNYPGAGPSGFDAVSLIEGYAASRALPNRQDPNTPNDAGLAEGTAPQNWLSAMNNEGTNQTANVIRDLITENDQSPYPFEGGEIVGAPGTYFTDTQYPGGANQLYGLQFVDGSFFNTTDNSNKLYLKGDNFPCGLVRIDNSSGEQLSIAIDLVPGTHRGYLCEPMTEM